MKSIRCFSAVLSIALFCAGHPASAQDVKMYLKAVSVKQGAFKAPPGKIEALGEGYIPLTNVSFNEQTPADASHYKDKGVTQRQTLKVTKPVDASSPQFLAASMNHEAFTSVILKFVKPEKTGREVVFMTLTLTGASISDFSQNANSEIISFKYTEMKLDEPAAK
jgi:type VI secretion system Hcp family effector